VPQEPFRPSEYLKPNSVPEAVEMLWRCGVGARLLAGGTDLLVERNPAVGALVDIEGLGLSYVREAERGISIGAATTIAQVAESDDLDTPALGVLRECAESMATAQIRNVATIGGNVCTASSSGDFAPALLALGASVTVAGRSGDREMGLDDFFVGNRRTVLQPHEIALSFFIPSHTVHTGSAFTRVSRAHTDIALVNVGVRVDLDPMEVVCEARIVLGAVGPTPLRASKAEQSLMGHKMSLQVAQRAGVIAAGETEPISDHRTTAEYRRAVSGVLVERALLTAVARIA
jgi:CO/xanthine dehydrogenase FAD-binding subunit